MTGIVFLMPPQEIRVKKIEECSVKNCGLSEAADVSDSGTSGAEFPQFSK
jgi:hypothetical protein